MAPTATLLGRTMRLRLEEGTRHRQLTSECSIEPPGSIRTEFVNLMNKQILNLQGFYSKDLILEMVFWIM